MRLLVAITIVVLLLASAAEAARPAFGVKAGLALSGQSFDYRDFDTQFDNRTGFQFGAFLEYPINRYFSLSPEFRYVPVGVKSTVTLADPEAPEGTGETVTYQSRIDYFSVPLMIKARLPMESVTPYILAGPRVDFQVGTKDGYFSAVYDQLDQITAGFTVGGGMEIELSPVYRLLLEISYSPDISNVYETELLSIKNHTVSFLAGISF